MARFNPDIMGLDDGQVTRRVFGTQAETPTMTDAEIKAASIAAAKELAMTPYSELPTDVKASMTRAEKQDYISEARKEKTKLAAEERAASDPMFDFTNRPDAPVDPDGNFINYYSWIGGRTNGEWKLYRATNNLANREKYGSRAIGGETQAISGTIVGANALVVQPQPVKNVYGEITGWKVPSGNETSTGDGTVTGATGATGSTGSAGAASAAQEAAARAAAAAAAALAAANAGTNAAANAETNASIKALQDQIAALTQQISGRTAADAATAEQKALEEKQRKENALTSLTARFSQYGLASLVPKIRELVINGSTEATIAFELQETEEYKQRFKANTERLKKGLSVLDAGTYIGMEDSYRQALRAYGLKQFDTDDYVSQFIANDISANELSNRIVTAVQRVQNADPAITSQLREFYNIGQNDLVAYVLDPNQQFQKIERQVQAAEIGVAARRQGLQAGVGVAEQLAAQGVTQAEAQKGYATIADILPDAKRLSEIFGSTLEGYDQAQGEQEVFNQLASAQRRRQKLTQREIAAFGGQSGLSTKALTTDLTGQY